MLYGSQTFRSKIFGHNISIYMYIHTYLSPLIGRRQDFVSDVLLSPREGGEAPDIAPNSGPLHAVWSHPDL
jgi:hypothetical protein